MNEIESEVEGVIVRILVENGHSVEYGEPLFLIEPVNLVPVLSDSDCVRKKSTRHKH